jgi:hypothetical protein
MGEGVKTGAMEVLATTKKCRKAKYKSPPDVGSTVVTKLGLKGLHAQNILS